MKKLGCVGVWGALLLVLVVGVGARSESTSIPLEGDLGDTPYGTIPNGVYSMRFAIYDADRGGRRIWPGEAEYEEHPLVIVMGGRFRVELGSMGHPVSRLPESEGGQYVQVWVCQPAGFECPGFEPIPVRLPLDAPTESGIGTPPLGESRDGPSPQTPPGTGDVRGAWLLGGNVGTSPATDFLGTTDDVPLTLRVGGSAAFRLEPHATSPNVIGGHRVNSVLAGAFGATIGGGGDENNANRVSAGFATIGGGTANRVLGGHGTVAGGYWNEAHDFAFVGGGARNWAMQGWYATISGGYENVATGNGATIAGGRNNSASGLSAAVAGGFANGAGGAYSFAAGGRENRATGDNSFAAGYRAAALHSGSFVWADAVESGGFASTRENQFLVRATGGAVFHLGTSRFGMTVVSGVRGADSSVLNSAPYYPYWTIQAANYRADRDAIGVWGHAGGAPNLSANPGQVGVFGSSVSGYGLVGVTSGSDDGRAAGMFRAEATLGETFGVYATNASSDEGSAGGFFRGEDGVIAVARYSGTAVAARVERLESGDASGYGVYAEGGQVGVYGEARPFQYFADSAGRVDMARTKSPTYGVYGKSDSPYGYGLYSEGNTHIDGALSWRPKTSYMSVGPWAFDTHQWWGVEGSTEVRPPTDCPTTYLWDGVYFAAISLPHGARLTRIEFHWKDASPRFDAELTLRRTDLAGGIQDIASIKSHGSDETVKSHSDRELDHTVDNQTGTYLLQLVMGCDTWFYGTVIEYEVRAPY